MNLWDMATNALWIMGLAVVLAALSYASWLADQRKTRLRRVLNEAVFQVPFAAGMTLTCAGIFFHSRSLLERIAWAVLAVLFAAQGVATWREKHRRESYQGVEQSPNKEKGSA